VGISGNYLAAAKPIEKQGFASVPDAICAKSDSRLIAGIQNVLTGLFSR